MYFRERFFRSNFLIKLRSWEYWPFYVVQFPIFLYFIWLSLRARSFMFFTASNPGITMGGMVGESKYDVLKKIPQHLVPKSLLVKQPSTKEEILQQMLHNGLSFPVIFKPDLGERGFMVKRIHDEADIEQYLQEMKFDFIVQEFVDLPLELGVFYTRIPHQENGKVTSVVIKEMLTVTGDGVSTLKQLVLNKDRAKLQWDVLKEKLRDNLEDVVPKDKRVEIVSIGNHCLGTTFLNGNHLINQQLSDTFDAISKQINGFYFGRYDLRCNSIEDLYAGKVKIMELNGCGAEPAHIYNPGYSLVKAQQELVQHWQTIFLISRENARQGIRYISVREGVHHFKTWKSRTSIPTKA